MEKILVLVHTGYVNYDGNNNYRINLFEDDYRMSIGGDDLAFLKNHGMKEKYGKYYIKGSQSYLKEHMGKRFHSVLFIY